MAPAKRGEPVLYVTLSETDEDAAAHELTVDLPAEPIC
jgi:hypothetical protein